MDSIYIHTAHENLKDIWLNGKDENLILGDEEASENNSYQTRKPTVMQEVSIFPVASGSRSALLPLPPSIICPGDREHQPKIAANSGHEHRTKCALFK